MFGRPCTVLAPWAVRMADAGADPIGQGGDGVGVGQVGGDDVGGHFRVG